jgi:hypothetical protein
MKLVAVLQTADKISLIYSDPERGEMVSHEFSLDDPELEKKLMPHMNEPLLKKHLERHPEVIRKRPEGRGS